MRYQLNILTGEKYENSPRETIVIPVFWNIAKLNYLPFKLTNVHNLFWIRSTRDVDNIFIIVRIVNILNEKYLYL